MTRTLILALSLVCLAGCGVSDTVREIFSVDKDNTEPPAPLVQFTQRVNVIELWSESSGSGTGDQYLNLAPVVANQRVFIVDSDGQVRCMDAVNGRTLWTRKLKQGSGFKFWASDEAERITGGPGYGEDTVMVGTSEGRVIAINSENGQELWSARVSSEVLSAPQKSANIVIVRTLDGKIFALDGDDGKRLWVYDRSVPALTLRGTSTPVIYQGIVIAGFDGGRLAALELETGRVLWEARISTGAGSTELEQMVDLDSTPLVYNGIIYVATYQGSVAAVQLESGRIVWTRDVSSYAGISADDNNIYVTDEDSHLWAFERYTGTSVWKQEKLHARGATAPAAIGNYLVVGDVEGYLHWIDKESGNFVARTRLAKDRIIVQPVNVGKVLYAYCSDGRLAAYTYR